MCSVVGVHVPSMKRLVVSIVLRRKGQTFPHANIVGQKYDPANVAQESNVSAVENEVVHVIIKNETMNKTIEG